MKREIDTLRSGHSGCCPGHDDYPTEKYSSRRSTKARSRDKTKEHKHVRTLNKRVNAETVEALGWVLGKK